MHGLSGAETARRMRRMLAEFKKTNPDSSFATPYICCLTAFSGKEFRDKAIGAGMDEFFLKPLPSSNFKALLVKTRVLN